MHLRPRHYILIALVLALGLYNIVRLRQKRPMPEATPVQRAPLPTGPRPESPRWEAFDHAASLRDASADQFAPALAAFTKLSGPEAPADPDLGGCSTWLQFYRQSVLHPSRDPAWHNRSSEHLDTCVKYHRDVAS